jgi:hypothetical protein
MTATNPDTLARLVADTPGAHWVDSEGPDGVIGQAAWVAYGPGFEIPLTFEYAGTGPFEWRVQILVLEGRPQCVRFESWTLDPDRPVTPEALHRFPLGQAIEEATLMASRPADQIPRRLVFWDSAEQARAERTAVRAHYRQRPKSRKPKKLTDEFLTEVADVYRKNVATGKPSKAVQEHFHYTPASARRVVSEARRRDFLGPARPGRGGEQSQPKEEDDG